MHDDYEDGDGEAYTDFYGAYQYERPAEWIIVGVAALVILAILVWCLGRLT